MFHVWTHVDTYWTWLGRVQNITTYISVFQISDTVGHICTWHWAHLMRIWTREEFFSVCEGSLASKRRRRRSRRRKKRRRRRGRRMTTDQHSRPLSFSWFSDLKTPLVRNANLRYERERKREGGLSNVLSARDLGETYRGFLAMYYLLTACWGWEWHRIMLSFWCSYTTLPKTYGSFSDVYLAREEYLFQERGLLTPCLCLHYQEIAMAPCLCFVGWRYLLSTWYLKYWCLSLPCICLRW